MAITFSTYPSTNRVPGLFFEVDPSNANTGVTNNRYLVVGQKLPTGSAAANTPVFCSTFRDAKALCGPGSMLANMVDTIRSSDQFGEIWILPVDDNGAGVASVHTATVTGPATAAGTLSLYVAGTAVQVAVANGDTATAVATKLAAAVNANADLLVTATSSAGVVTLTNRHKGQAAGDVDLRLNYLGTPGGELTPAGLAVAFANPTPGATDPLLDAALAATGEKTFDYVVTPSTLR